MASSLAFDTAAFFNAATPPVFAITAIFRPAFAIFTIRLNLFKYRSPPLFMCDTIYDPPDDENIFLLFTRG